MIVVALRALNGSIDAEAPHLARDLGVAAYDARLKLSQPTPSIFLRTNDSDAAHALAASLRARGHDAVAIDEAHVPEALSLRTFRFTTDAIESADERIAYLDITALVRAIQTTRTETIERVTERKLRPAAALATGGLILSKKTTRDEKRIGQDREDLLFILARKRPPWLIAERTTSYASLETVAASQRENFLRVVTTLRERAPHAMFDERLLSHRGLDSLDAIALRACVIASGR